MSINHRRLARVTAFFAALYVTSIAVYTIFEHHTIGDAAWWAFMTFTTVGYGDQYPHTLLGRVAAISIVVSAVFVAVPFITAMVLSRLLVDHDEWTHDEQEEVKYLLRRLAELEEIEPYEPSKN